MTTNTHAAFAARPQRVRAAAEPRSTTGTLVLLGFTRGDVQMAVCSELERRKPAEGTDQNVVVFVREIRPADGGLVADCLLCGDEHRVEEDFFEAVADGAIDVTQGCDTSATTFELSDVFRARLDELRAIPAPAQRGVS